MSRIKDYNIIDIEAMDDERLEKSESGKIQVTRVYIKSDADKAIRHKKYKRCIAMAEQCKESMRLMRTYEVTDDYWNLEPGHDAEYFCKKGDFYSKWRKRWLKIAEQFKEAKCR